jgi:hypothetical protein
MLGRPKGRKTKDLAVRNRRLHVARLYLEGRRTIYELAQELSVSAMTISTDLRAIKKEWAQQFAGDYNQKVSEEWARLGDLIAKAATAYEKSCEQVVRVKGKEVAREPRPGNPRYLEEIRQCIALRLRCIGALSADTNVNFANVAPRFSWDDFFDSIPAGPVPDEVEAQVQRAIAFRPPESELVAENEQSKVLLDGGHCNGESNGKPHG